MKRLILLLLAGMLPATAALAAPSRVTLNAADFRDRVYACWLGKNIGGTLGMRYEGAREPHDLTYFDPVPQTPAANDDLDLQILWLKCAEERGTGITARDLGDYWLKYVPVDWNEYGVGKANMRQGFLPPISGQFRNERWRDSNGAWIRSEIWACLAPGCPALAARYAWEDACVDHGAAEGTYAELFTATLESAAFIEKDRDRLLAIAQGYIPPDCAVARSVRAAMDARRRGLDWKAAREAVIEASKSTGWFMAPQNVAFTILGWLYGDGDFGKSICIAVNCGDDTDCTGATLGSLLGILNGTAGIPDRWRKPVGEGIRCVAIGGFPPPANLQELTDRTVAMAKRVLTDAGAPVAIGESQASGDPQSLRLEDAAAAKALWARSPYQVAGRYGDVQVTLDYGSEPWIEAGKPREVRVLLANAGTRPVEVGLAWHTPPGVTVDPAMTVVRVPAGGAGSRKTNRRGLRGTQGETGDVSPLSPSESSVVGPSVSLKVVLQAEEVPEGGVLRGALVVAVGRKGGNSEARLGDNAQGTLPFAFAEKIGIHKGDLALARLGATATSDSEYERDAGGTARVIDGEIARDHDFEGKRWHSALTPHPHWVAIHLPQARAVGRAILHFADPQGHPTDFALEASDDGTRWQTLCEERGYADPRRYDKQFTPVTARHFRLTVRRSANPQYPNAAQVSEIELLPK